MTKKPRQLVSSAEAVQADKQHTSPCGDCPFARTALPGWLGGETVETFIQIAHSDTHYPCHTIDNQQCAGLAIYRRNVCKRVEPPLLVLPADREKVFARPQEFQAHHGGTGPLRITGLPPEAPVRRGKALGEILMERIQKTLSTAAAEFPSVAEVDWMQAAAEALDAVLDMHEARLHELDNGGKKRGKKKTSASK